MLKMSDILKMFCTKVGRRITPRCGPVNKINMFIMFSEKIIKRKNFSSDMPAKHGQMR